MCNCIEEIENKVKLEHDADLVRLENSKLQFGNRGSEVRHAKYKKGSNVVFGRSHYITVPWQYCPFCGVKI